MANKYALTTLIGGAEGQIQRENLRIQFARKHVDEAKTDYQRARFSLHPVWVPAVQASSWNERTREGAWRPRLVPGKIGVEL